jgi:hypothetical protein
MGRPFTASITVFYLAYGALIFVVLATFARLYRRKQLEGSAWMTVLLTGTILLNPRIMFYDALAITVPMLLLVMRGWQSAGRWCLLVGSAATLAAYVAGQDNTGDAILLVTVFVGGVCALVKEARSVSAAPVSPVPEAAKAAAGL